MKPRADRTLRVLQLDPGIGTGVDLYRIRNLREQLECEGHSSRVLSVSAFEASAPSKRQLDDELRDVDLLILHRVAWSAWVAALLAACARRGVVTVFEADDLVFIPGAEGWVDGVRRLDAGDQVLYGEGVERYAATYRACDAFLASTPFLAGLRPYGRKPTGIVRNVLGREQLARAAEIREARRARAGAEIVIGFGAGSATHDRDFAVVAPVLRRLLEETPGLQLVAVGPLEVGEHFAGYEDRVTLEDLRPWQEWWAALADFDIAVAPLEQENPYCRAKSALKYLEAAIVGVPIVASRTAAFEDCVRDGETALLASDADEWFAALSQLIEDAEKRKALARAAFEHVSRGWTTEAVAAQSVETLLALSAGEDACSDVPRPILDLAWLIPSPFVGSGGHANIFAVAAKLEERGHRTTFHVDPGQLEVSDGDDVRRFVDRNFQPTGSRFEIGWDLSGRRYDAVVATSWATAEFVSQSDAAECKLYFVSDLENRFFAAGEEALRAELTYRLPLSCITLGQWLTAELRARYDRDSTAYSFPVTIEEGAGEGIERAERPTLAYFAQPSKPRRAYQLGLEGLTRFHDECPEVRIIFFGSKDVDPSAVPFPFEDRGILSEDQLAGLYREAHAALAISITNPTLVSANMMRCGCVPIDLDLDNNQYEYRHEHDSLLADPTPEGIASALRRVMRDDALRSRLQANGLETVAERSLEHSVDEIEAAMVRGFTTGSVEAKRAQLDIFQGEGASWRSTAEGCVRQRFRASAAGLCRVALRLGTFDQLPGDVLFELADPATDELLRSELRAGARVSNDSWNEFTFETLRDSAGRQYELRVSTPEAGANGVAVYHADATPDAHGLDGLFAGDERVDGVARFKTWCAGELPPPGVEPSAAALAGPQIARSAPPVEVVGVPPVLPPRAASESVVEHVPSEQARRLAEMIRSASSRDAGARADVHRRVAALESGVRVIDSGAFTLRLRALLSRRPWGRLLSGLGVLPPTEVYLEQDRFVTAQLRASLSVGQRFVAEQHGLSRVSVRVATEGRKLHAPIRMLLRDGGPRGQIVREVQIAADRIDDNQFATASFMPIEDSQNRVFTIELLCPQAWRGVGPRLWGTRERGERSRRRYHMGTAVSGALDLRAGYGEAQR